MHTKNVEFAHDNEILLLRTGISEKKLFPLTHFRYDKN